MSTKKVTPTDIEVELLPMKDYVTTHKNWSLMAFGEGDHLEGLLKHIEKEVEEVRQELTKDNQFKELVDIIILTIDAMWRLGYHPDEIVRALLEKQNINIQRKWPKITDPSKPTEHFKEDPADLNAHKHIDDFTGRDR